MNITSPAVRPSRRVVRGFTLVETVLAVGVASLCLTSVFGLLPAGISSNHSSAEQTTATNLLTAVAADVRGLAASAASTSTSSTVYKIDLSGGSAASAPTQIYVGDDGMPVTSVRDARYQLNVWVTPASATTGATMVRTMVSWPAAAPVRLAQGSVEALVALNRN